jgi:single-strand DNA-binding protein
MNNWVGIGRLVADPEIRYIPESQTAVGKFKIAIDDGYGDKKTTDFIPIVCFGKTAENVEKFLSKGKLCAVHGRIKTGSYKNKEGVTVYTTEINSDRVEFLEPKQREFKAEDENQDIKYDPKGKPPAIPEGFQALEDDDDIPF